MAEPLRHVKPLMKTTEEIASLRRQIAAWKDAGKTIAFVPTMGALHPGHLSLIDIARSRADRVVASIFVNPTQFGPLEDLDHYPRTLEGDLAKLSSAGCDLLFHPSASELYPSGHDVWIEPGRPASGLEGDRRPGHFRGVATVVTMLLNIVQPDVAVFGEKDAQQLVIVRKLVQDLHLPVEILSGPTLRAADGLALSSRNRFLTPAEREVAPVLFRALTAARERVASGVLDCNSLRRGMLEILATEEAVKVDYIALVDAGTFSPVQTITNPVVAALAVHLGTTHLIDNLTLSPPALD